MQVGVVVLNYNDYITTIECINMLDKINNIDCIVIVDNNSPNNSYSILQEINKDNKFILLRSDNNNGYASGNNIGIKYLLDNTSVDVIGIVNPDVVFDEEFINKIKDVFECYPDYSLITGLQYDSNGKISDRAFWRRLKRKDLIIQNLYFLSKITKNYEASSKYINEIIKQKCEVVNVDVVEGCCFFIRSNDISQVGLLDEDTFLFYEEDILSYKLHALNKKTCVVTTAKFYHYHSKTLKSIYSAFRTEFISLKSREVFYKKYIRKNLFDDILFKLTKLVFYIEKYILYFIKMLLQK